MQYVNSLLDLIGNTPLLRLSKSMGSLDGAAGPIVLAKVEYLNPGGSVKDRIATRMIEAAEASGELQPGGTIVEPTSGNTGVGLAMVAQAKGYKCVFVCPDKVSEDKRNVLKAYGAEVRRHRADDGVPAQVHAPVGELGDPAGEHGAGGLLDPVHAVPRRARVAEERDLDGRTGPTPAVPAARVGRSYRAGHTDHPACGPGLERQHAVERGAEHGQTTAAVRRGGGELASGSGFTHAHTLRTPTCRYARGLRRGDSRL